MIRLKNFFLPALLFSSALFYAQYTDEINTNRPGQSMSGFSVGKTIVQVETGIYGIMEEHEVLNYKTKGIGLDATIRYGAILEELEFIANLQYQFDQYENAIYVENRNNFKQMTLGAKYLIYDPDKNYKPEVNLYSWKANHRFKWHNILPAIAVYAGANIVVGKDNPYTFPGDGISPKIMLITHNHFGKWVWVNNIIGDKLTTDYPSYGGISTLTRGFNERWSGFIEYQGYISDYYADGIFRIGAAHLLGANIQVDASLSKNIKNTPNIMYGGVGFSWRFDANYVEIKLAGESDLEKSLSREEKKKAKKALKEKKRMDEIQPDGN